MAPNVVAAMLPGLEYLPLGLLRRAHVMRVSDAQWYGKPGSCV